MVLSPDVWLSGLTERAETLKAWNILLTMFFSDNFQQTLKKLHIRNSVVIMEELWKKQKTKNSLNEMRKIKFNNSKVGGYDYVIITDFKKSETSW